MLLEWLDNNKKGLTYQVNKQEVTITLTDLANIDKWYRSLTDEYEVGNIYTYLLKSFDPGEHYKLTLGGYVTIIKVKESKEREAYDRVFKYISDGLYEQHSIEVYSWLVRHTELVDQSGVYYLKGDKEFNQVVTPVSIDGLYEVQRVFPRVELSGLTFKLPYIDGMTQIMDELGWNINNEYYVLGSHGYYLPFGLELDLAEVIEWVLGVGRKHGRHITHQIQGKHIHVRVKGKDDFVWLAQQFRQDLGNSDFLMMVLTKFKLGANYTVKHKEYTLTFSHYWVSRNIRYAEQIHNLTKEYNFELATGIKHPTLLYYRVLKDSSYDSLTDSVKLKGYLYGELGIRKEDVVGDLEEVYVDVFQDNEDAYGEPVPLIYSYAGINIQTPFKIIEEGVFKLDVYRLYTPPIYDTEPILEPYINAYIMGEERRVIQHYAAEEDVLIQTTHRDEGLVQDDFDIELPDITTVYKSQQDTSLLARITKIPYVQSAVQLEKTWVVTYTTGGQVILQYDTYTTDEDILVRVLHRKERDELNTQQKDILNVIQAVFYRGELQDFKYQPPKDFKEEWEAYLLGLAEQTVQVFNQEEYQAVQSLERKILNYPTNEGMVEIDESLSAFMQQMTQIHEVNNTQALGKRVEVLEDVLAYESENQGLGDVDIGSIFNL